MEECTTWQCINSFALWISSVGTVATLTVTIWLAVRDKWPRVNIYTGKVITLPNIQVPKGGSVEFETENCPFFFEAWVSSTGHCPVPIESCYWLVRLHLNQHLAIATNTTSSELLKAKLTSLPKTLQYGQRATLIYDPFTLPASDNSSHGTKIKFLAWLRVHSLKFEVRTTVGKSYIVRANKEIKQALWKSYKEKYL
jgi:hypothetical protein